MKAALLTAITVATTLLIACGNGDDDDDHAASDGTGDVQEITITTSASQLVFSPDTIRAKVGQPVKLVFDNSEGTVLHDWSIEEMHVSNVHTEGGAEHMMDMDDDKTPTEGGMDETPMAGGDAHEAGMEGGFALHIAADANSIATINFTPEEAGEYTFYCTVEGHRQAGMEGTLIVE